MRGGKGPGRPSLVRCRRVIALRQFDYDASSAESWCSPWLIDCRQRAGPAMPRSVTRLTRLLSACRHPGPGRGAAPRSRGRPAAFDRIVSGGRQAPQLPSTGPASAPGSGWPRARPGVSAVGRAVTKTRARARRFPAPLPAPQRAAAPAARQAAPASPHGPGQLRAFARNTHTTENVVMCDRESHGNRNRRLELRRDCVRSRQPFRVTQRDAGIVVWTF